jgi:hypothetical protein
MTYNDRRFVISPAQRKPKKSDCYIKTAVLCRAKQRKEGVVCVRVVDAAHVKNAENPSKTANAADAEKKLASVRVRNESIWF